MASGDPNGAPLAGPVPRAAPLLPYYRPQAPILLLSPLVLSRTRKASSAGIVVQISAGIGGQISAGIGGHRPMSRGVRPASGHPSRSHLRRVRFPPGYLPKVFRPAVDSTAAARRPGIRRPRSAIVAKHLPGGLASAAHAPPILTPCRASHSAPPSRIA